MRGVERAQGKGPVAVDFREVTCPFAFASLR